MADLKFGRRPPKRAPALRLAPLLTGVIPVHPPSEDYLAKLSNWDMLGNDQYGNCLAEGTLVDGPSSPRVGYRIPYSGPMITIVTESGRILAVTPNHAVLTPRGFVLARQLQEGDYTVCGSFSQKLSSLADSVDTHLNHAPTPVEQVVATLGGVGLTGREMGQSRVVSAGDFHSDGRFMHGNIDVVWTDRFLNREFHAALRQPDRESQISAASELQSKFHRFGAALQATSASRSAAFGNIGRLRNSSTFISGHAGIAERERLPLSPWLDPGVSHFSCERLPTDSVFSPELLDGLPSLVASEGICSGEVHLSDARAVHDLRGLSVCPDWYAGFDHPVDKCLPVDSELYSNLLRRFPGDVATERIVKIRNDFYSGHVYDLSTDERWYAANGIITHNCVAVTWSNVRRLMTATLGGQEQYPRIDQVFALYKTQNPGFPAEDNGMDIQTCLEYLQHTGGPDGVKAVAFAQVDHKNLDEVKAALAIFGFVWTGLTVLRANMQQFDAGQPWDYVARSPVDGGHSVIAGGYLGQARNDVRFITWAQETAFTDAFWAHEVEEAWVIVWPEHLGSAAFQTGIDMAALAADYQAITGKVLPVPTPPPAPTPTPYNVLPGILKAMTQYGDRPASNEVDGIPGQTREAVGVSGRHYEYVVATNMVNVFMPDATITG